MKRTWRSFDASALVLSVFLLATMAVPALWAARRNMEQEQCASNLQQLGAAFTQVVDARRGLPPRRTGFNDGRPYGGWGGEILAFVEGAPATDQYDRNFDFFDPRNASISETPYSFMLCPSSPSGRFVEIQSQATTKSLNEDKSTVFQCRAAVVDYISSNGVLMTEQGYGINAFASDDRVGNQRQPMADNEYQSVELITDGLSQTLLLIEQAGRPSVWRNQSVQEGDGQFGMSPNARGAWAGWGSIAFGAVNAATGERPGRGDATDCSVNCNNWFGIYGFHPEGANVLFCDGSVRFMTRRLDPLTFAYLTVRDDGQLIDPSAY